MLDGSSGSSTTRLEKKIFLFLKFSRNAIALRADFFVERLARGARRVQRAQRMRHACTWGPHNVLDQAVAASDEALVCTRTPAGVPLSTLFASARAEPQRLAVNEMCAAVQWVGTWSGTPVIVVRVQGCDVGCRYCDVPETWHDPRAALRPDWKRRVERWRNMSAEEILEWARASYKHLRHVVITGGEPALQPASAEVAQRFLSAGYFVQYETSATHALPVNLPARTWVTASPKFYMPGGHKVREDVLERANEIVMPLSRERDLQALQQVVIPRMRRGVSVYLHPVRGGALSSQALAEAFARGYRVTTRVHELAK